MDLKKHSSSAILQKLIQVGQSMDVYITVDMKVLAVPAASLRYPTLYRIPLNPAVRSL